MIPQPLMDELQALVLQILPTKERLEQALARAFDEEVREYRLTGLRVTEGQHVIDSVWWETGRAPVVRDVLDELQERELIGAAWFDQLRAAAPGRREEIEALEARIQAELAAGPRPPGDGDDPGGSDGDDPGGSDADDPVVVSGMPWSWVAGVLAAVVVLLLALGVVGAQQGWFVGGGDPGATTGDTDPDSDSDTSRDTDTDTDTDWTRTPDDTDPPTNGLQGAETISAAFDVAWVVSLQRTCGTQKRSQFGLTVDLLAIATVGGTTGCTWEDGDGGEWRAAAIHDGVALLRPKTQARTLTPVTLTPIEAERRVARVPLDARRLERVQPLDGRPTATSSSVTGLRPVELTAVGARQPVLLEMKKIELDKADLLIANRRWDIVRERSVFRSSDLRTVVRAMTIVSNRPVFQSVAPTDASVTLSTYVGTKDVPLIRKDGTLRLPPNTEACDGSAVLTANKTVAGLCRTKPGSGGVVQVLPIAAQKVVGVLDSQGVVAFLVP